jgi:nucleobase:cation symporter-1, NCS1 family
MVGHPGPPPAARRSSGCVHPGRGNGRVRVGETDGVATVGAVTTGTKSKPRWDEGQFARPEHEGDLTLEQQGMAPIPQSGRYGGKLRIFTVWFTPNLVPAAFFAGTLATASYIGLSFWWAIIAIVLGNLIGSIPVGLLAAMGPKTGMAQLPLARLPFGKTIPIPGFVNWLSTIAWDGVNGLFGAEALALIFHVPFPVGLLIVIAAQGVLAVFGYEVIHLFEKWMSIVLAIIFIILTVKIATIGNVHIHQLTHGANAVGGFVLMVTIIASFVLAWAVYAADYTRYMKPETSSVGVFWRTVAGLSLGSAWLEILGLCAASLAVSQTSTQIYDLMGKGALGVLAMVGIALGTVAVDAMDDYTGSLSLQSTGIEIPRPVSAVVVALGGFGLALYMHEGNLATKFTNFLLFISYWVAPFAGVVLVDWWKRRGQVDTAKLLDWARLDTGWQAIVALLAGFGASVPFMDSSLYVGAVSSADLHGGDIAYYVGFLVAAIVYAVLRPNLGREPAGSVAATREMGLATGDEVT